MTFVPKSHNMSITCRVTGQGQSTGPYAGGGGFRGFRRTAHSLVEVHGGCMRLAWHLATLHGCSKWSGCGRLQVGPITFSQTKHAHKLIHIRTSQAVSKNSWGFTKFTQLHVVTSRFVMFISCVLRARIDDGTGSNYPKSSV